MARGNGHGGRTGARMLAMHLLLAGPLAAGWAGDTSYRWVDDDGEVHYGDRLSPEQAKRKHQVVDDSGVVRDERDPEGERGAQGDAPADAAGETTQATDAAEQNGDESAPAPRPDEMLLEAFPNEQMLLDTRDRRLESIQSRIDLTRQNIERLASSHANRQQRLRSLPDDSNQRTELEQKLQELEQRMAEQREHLSDLEAEKAELRAQFKADVERYRELKADEGAD